MSPLLPSNPNLLLSAARRNSAAQEATNGYASVKREIEIAGQRGVRRDAAEARIAAQSQRVVLSRRETAAAAITAFFDALAAREEHRLTMTADTVTFAARARADQGLIATVDADVADAVAVEVLQAKLAAARRVVVANAELSVLLGLDATRTPAVEGELAPLPEGTATLASRGARSVGERPKLLALEAERRASSLRADVFRRSRIPNPTLSLIAQKRWVPRASPGRRHRVPHPPTGQRRSRRGGDWPGHADAVARSQARGCHRLRRRDGDATRATRAHRRNTERHVRTSGSLRAALRGRIVRRRGCGQRTAPASRTAVARAGPRPRGAARATTSEASGEAEVLGGLDR